METTSGRPLVGTLLLTAIAPVAWGSGYFVTATFLPPDRPLFGALVRALPFGLVLLAVTRRLPHGIWWARTALLGTINVGAFFVLVFVAAYRLPGGLAATLTALSPLAVAVLAWALLRERPTPGALAGGVLGLAGVGLLVLRAGFAVDPLGIAAALGAVLLFSTGSVLVKRWPAPVDLLTFTSWQLVAGGLALLPVAVVVEGAPPVIDLRAAGGYLFIGGVGTVVAYAVWFRGLQRLPATSVGLVGLLNPLAGTLLGVVAAGEAFGAAQAVGTVLVLGGLVAGQVRPRRRSRAGTGQPSPRLVPAHR